MGSSQNPPEPQTYQQDDQSSRTPARLQAPPQAAQIQPAPVHLAQPSTGQALATAAMPQVMPGQMSPLPPGMPPQMPPLPPQGMVQPPPVQPPPLGAAGRGEVSHYPLERDPDESSDNVNPSKVPLPPAPRVPTGVPNVGNARVGNSTAIFESAGRTAAAGRARRRGSSRAATRGPAARAAFRPASRAAPAGDAGSRPGDGSRSSPSSIAWPTSSTPRP